jgi:hypothetical protein
VTSRQAAELAPRPTDSRRAGELARESAESDTTSGCGELHALLAPMREQPGCPDGSDAAIVAMSASPAHTACPNPYLRDWVEEHVNEDRRPSDPGPFAADSAAGKTSDVYRAHSFPTKVPHEAIMRLILHYTKPGDIVLDGFCGTGMAGVAAQMCANPSVELRRRIEGEMQQVQWGARRAVLQDISPGATFIAAGLNLPVDAGAFDRASALLLDRFDAEYGWMYETGLADGRVAQVAYTVWSEVLTCPHCGAAVVFFDVAFDERTGRVREDFECGSCGAATRKSYLERRFVTVRTLAGDSIERVEYRPVRLEWRVGSKRGLKRLDDADRAVLRRIAMLRPTGFPTNELPLGEMVHGSRLGPKGFTAVHHLWSDRALVALTALWQWAGEEPNPGTRRALRFWIEQAFWGFSWMNRYRPDGFSQVSQYQPGVYYVGSLHAEPSPRYNLEGSRPASGKRRKLVDLWGRLCSDPSSVRIGTGSSTRLDIPDATVDYIFVDPPFGSNIPYADLAMVVESWHGVLTAPAEEAITDPMRKKGLPEYADLMERCFREFHRVLKPGRWMTVEFSNSSNAVWMAIQQALAVAGFVVADTRVLDKQQHSFRQVTAHNAVKRDLIISAYKPQAAIAEEVRLAQGSENGVWAFVREHLRHLPVADVVDNIPCIVRERLADRLYDRMVAYHVAQGIGLPIDVAGFYAGIDEQFMVREGMYFLPEQAPEWERMRASRPTLEQAETLITGESSAVAWLRQFLGERALPFSEIQPPFFAEIQKGAESWEELPDLGELLAQNFVTDEHERWQRPDPRKASHLEQLRARELLRVFDAYLAGRGALDHFRSEAVRAGFKRAYDARDYHTILAVGRRLPEEAFNDDPALLHYFRNAERLAKRS